MKKSVSLLLLFWCVSCDDRPEVLDQSLEVVGPVVVGRYMVYLDQTRERVTLVRPGPAEVRQVAVGRRPSFMLPSPDHSRLLVICKGWVATTGDEESEEPSLFLINPETGETERHVLGSPFDEVAVSDDNRYAVAFFSDTANPGETEVFRNPNAVAILNMETGELHEKSVRSFGDVPRGVLFSPATMAPLDGDGVAGEPRTMAVVFARGYVTLLDVTHPERRETTVRLTLPGMGGSIVPEKMVFAPSAGAAYLIASGANDVFVLTLTSRQPSAEDATDYVVSINTLAAGLVPADLLLFSAEGQAKILVANQRSQDLTVIDAMTAEFVSIPAGGPVDRILGYPEGDPQQAVVFSQGHGRNSIYFLDLVDVEARRGQNLHVLDSTDAVVGVERIPGRAQALVTHDAHRSALSLLDLSQRTLSPFTGHAALADYALTHDGRVLVGFSMGRRQLGLVNLDDLSVRTLALDFVPQGIYSLEAPPEATDAEYAAVMVDHGAVAGLLTVIPNPTAPSEESPFLVSGFLLQGLFDDRYDD
jgi:hypothetical protein